MADEILTPEQIAKLELMLQEMSPEQREEWFLQWNEGVARVQAHFDEARELSRKFAEREQIRTQQREIQDRQLALDVERRRLHAIEQSLS